MTKRGFASPKQKTAPSTDTEPVETTSFKPTPTWKLIKPAFYLFKANFITLAVILIIPSTVSTLGQTLVSDFTNSLINASVTTVPAVDNSVLAGMTLIGISGLWIFANVPVLYYVQTRIARGETPGVIDSYQQGTRFLLRIYGLVILIACLMLATAVLIFPIFIFLRRYILAPYFLVDGNTGIRIAMQRSAHATRPYHWYMWGTLLFAMVVSGASFLVVQVTGPYMVLLTIPLACIPLLILTLRFKELSQHQSALR